MDDLVCFHERFVTAKTRRLAPHHFRDVCALASPRLRVALLKAAYGRRPAHIREGVIDYFSPRDIGRLREGDRAELAKRGEEILRTFHVVYRQRGAYRGLSAADTTLLLDRLDMDVGRTLLGREGRLAEHAALDEAAARHDEELRQRIPGDVVASLPPPFQSSVDVLPDDADMPNAAAHHLRGLKRKFPAKEDSEV